MIELIFAIVQNADRFHRDGLIIGETEPINRILSSVIPDNSYSYK